VGDALGAAWGTSGTGTGSGSGSGSGSGKGGFRGGRTAMSGFGLTGRPQRGGSSTRIALVRSSSLHNHRNSALSSRAASRRGERALLEGSEGASKVA